MKKVCTFIIVSLLLTTCFFIIPDTTSKVNAVIGATRGLKELTMYMEVDEASEASYIGSSTADRSAMSVSNAGDLNGDGFDDFIIGAYGSYNGGKTYIIFGKKSGWNMDVPLHNTDASYTGETNLQSTGRVVSDAGDVNMDGYDDFLIGAPFDERTYLIFGKSSGWDGQTSLSYADASFKGEFDGDQSGFTLSGAGDVNGDGYDDFLIGAKENDEGGSNAGQVYLFFGKSSGWSMNTELTQADASFIGEHGGVRCGGSLAGAGDVNGDGYDDILIGSTYSNGYAGKTDLIFGKPTGWFKNTILYSANASFNGERRGDFSSASVSGAGDVNGDGYDDFLIGANYNDEGELGSGQTYLFLGKSTGWTENTNVSRADASFLGEEMGDQSGCSVSGAGDVNGDGYDDIIIGAYGHDSKGIRTGQSYLIYGKNSGWTKDTNLSASNASFIGEGKDNQLGYSVSGAGDVDGDGFDDIIIGAWNNREGGINAGQTYLITGFRNNEPKIVYSCEIFMDNGYTIPASIADVGEIIYVELEGKDGNQNYRDVALVVVDFGVSIIDSRRVNCIETGENTGIYRGSFTIPPETQYLHTMSFTSIKDSEKVSYLFIDKPFRPTSIGSLNTYFDQNFTTEVNYAGLGDTLYIEPVYR